MWWCNYGGSGFGHMFFGGGILGFGLTALILCIIAILVLKLVRTSRLRKPENVDKSDSLMILKDRFARGQITEEEYRKMKEVLIS